MFTRKKKEIHFPLYANGLHPSFSTQLQPPDNLSDLRGTLISTMPAMQPKESLEQSLKGKVFLARVCEIRRRLKS
jgi:hypothetical protein